MFESKVEQLIKRSYADAKAAAEKERKRRMNDRLEIYHDEWTDLLRQRLAEGFSADNFKAMKLSIDTSQNILKRVIHEISLVYKSPATRKFAPDNTELADIYQGLKIDSFMKRVNRYGNLLNDLFILPEWDAEKEKMKLRILTPAVCSVIQNDDNPNIADAVYYEIDYVDSEGKGAGNWFYYWDAEEQFIFNWQTREVKPPSPDNKQMVNQYGQLPFAMLHMNQIDGMFWNPMSGQDLVEGCLWNGWKKTFKNHAFKFQSFKQLAAIGTEMKLPPEIKSDPSFMMHIDGNGDIKVLDMQLDFAGMDNTVGNDANAFLSTYGLNLNMFTASPETLSGRAMEIKNRGLKDIREDQIEVFREFEQELLNKIILVYNVEAGKSISDKTTITVDFAEPEINVDPLEQRKQALWDLRNNLISPAQFYMKFNPDVKDEAEAEKRMAENAAKLKQIAGGEFNIMDIFSGNQNKKQFGWNGEDEGIEEKLPRLERD